MKKGDIVIIHGFIFDNSDPQIPFCKMIGKLSKEGYNVHLFRYNSHGNSLNRVIKELGEFIKSNNIKKCSFVATSLGAYILVKYLNSLSKGETNRIIDNIVLTFPLLEGSESLIDEYQLHLLNKKETGTLLYSACKDKLSPKKLPHKVKLGIISGRKRININYVVSLFNQVIFLLRANDGLLSVEETKLGSHERLIMPVDHFSGNSNARVIKAVERFIDKGTFKRK